MKLECDNLTIPIYTTEERCFRLPDDSGFSSRERVLKTRDAIEDFSGTVDQLSTF